MDETKPKKAYGLLFAARIAFFVGAPAAATLLGFLGGLSWALDMFSHFRVQYAFLLAAAAIFLLWRRQRRLAAAAGVFALVNLSLILPFYFSRPAAAAPGALPLKIATFNAFAGNQERQKAWEFVRKESPDILLILEMQKAWTADLAGLSPQYAVLASEPREGTLGIALLSKIPARDVEFLHVEKDLGAFTLGSGNWLAVQAGFEWEGRPARLLGIHPAPPIAAKYARARDAELRAVSRWVRTQGDFPLVVAGDFNTSPWGHAFGSLVSETGLLNSQNGFGVQASWCDGCGILSLFKIPIDHVLHSRHWTTASRRLAPPLGSDHRMVVAELEWAQTE